MASKRSLLTRTIIPLVPAMKLDKNNLDLLAELDRDGRAPLSSVAKRIGVSRENAHYRFRQLCEQGIITRFSPLVDYFSLGYKCYRLLLNLENLGDTTRAEMIGELQNNHDLDLNVYLLNNWDLELVVWVSDDAEFYAFYDSFIKRHTDFIVDRKLFVVTRIHAFSHSYLHSQLYSIILGSAAKRRKQPVLVDEIDEKLLDILELNPREELVSIAAKLGIAATTVAYRIRRLEKEKILLGCMVKLDLNKIGYTKYHIEVLLADPSRKNEVINFLTNHASIVRIMELIGDRDLVFEGHFQNVVQVDDFLNQLKNKVPMIKNFEVRPLVQ